MVSSSKNDGAAFFCFQKQVWRIAILKHTYKLIFWTWESIKNVYHICANENLKYVKTLQADTGPQKLKKNVQLEKHPITLLQHDMVIIAIWFFDGYNFLTAT